LEQSGEYRIPAARSDVWDALNDPDVLGACIAGCQEVTRVDDEHFDLRVKAKIGPVSATFQAAVELTDLNPPVSYVIQGNVKGGAAGFAKGSASVALAEDGEATMLSYTVSASVGGKLAQVGSRLVDGAARKMADDFFAAFSTRMGGTEEAAGAERAADVEQGEQPVAAGEASPASGKDQWVIWAIAFAVLALALLLAL
jgi:carbon monoxide dehydrogenase subunit G